MEALLFFGYGLILMLPVFQLMRHGSHLLLSVRIAPFLIALGFVFPALPFLFSFLMFGDILPNHILLDVSRNFLWVSGCSFVGLYFFAVVIQFLKGTGQGMRDKWAILDARAEMAIGSGNYEGALSHYEEALRTDPNNYMGHYKFARLLNRVGFKKRAYDHLLLAVEHAPEEHRESVINGGIVILSSSAQSAVLADQFENQCIKRYGFGR